MEEGSVDHNKENFDFSISEMDKETNKIRKKINLNCFGNKNIDFKICT